MRSPVSPSFTLTAALLAGGIAVGTVALASGSASPGEGSARRASASQAPSSASPPPPAPRPTPGFRAPSPATFAALPAGLQRTPGQEGPQEPGLRDDPVPPHEFFFTRAIYTGYRSAWGRRQSWATDYPKADRQFLVVLKRVTNLDAYGMENAVSLADPALRRFPFLYALEVGWMNLTPEETTGLREYLEAGGFLVIDDFWGDREWANFQHQMSRVFPGREIRELPMDHPLFSTFYDIDEVIQVPNVRQGRWGGDTSERGGVTPRVLGIEDEQGRLMVVINWNTDLGDAWEWAEDPFYPLEYSTFAYEIGINTIIYAMSR